MNVFEDYSWPGNVRELENVIERVVAIEERETITMGCLPTELTNPVKADASNTPLGEGFSLNETLDKISRNYVQSALEETHGNLKAASTMLGINYRSLRYLVDKFGLKGKGAR
jgi:DNA-binding NtrC family response regulator